MLEKGARLRAAWAKFWADPMTAGGEQVHFGRFDERPGALSLDHPSAAGRLAVYRATDLRRRQDIGPDIADETPDNDAILLLDPDFVVLAMARVRVTSRPCSWHRVTTVLSMTKPSSSKSNPY